MPRHRWWRVFLAWAATAVGLGLARSSRNGDSLSKPMDEATEALAAELELISAMYGDEDMRSEADGVIEVLIRPQAADESLRFLEATLRLSASVSSGYPEAPAAARLIRARGLVGEEEKSLLAAGSGYVCAPSHIHQKA